MKKLIVFMAIAVIFAACGDEGKSESSALTLITAEESGENCENGGLKVETGFDENGDGILDEDEVKDTKYICDEESVTDGTDGSDGVDGENGDNGESGTDGSDGADGDDGTDGDAGACAGNVAPLINEINVNGIIYTGTAVDVYVDSPIEITVDATDADEDELSYNISGGFASMTDKGSGSYSALFTDVGTFSYTVIVSDGCQVTVGGFEVVVTEGIVTISTDSFWMGSPESELGRDNDETLHYVELTKEFFMDTFEVTQISFNDLMGYNPSYFYNCGDDCPVDTVNWHEALAYANERSKLEGLEECFDCTGTAPDFECSLKEAFTKPQDCLGYRLPTESEWEYAARSGSDTALYNGDLTYTDRTPLDPNLNAIGWYSGNSGVTYEAAFGCTNWYEGSINCGTHPVGEKLANSFGLYDMTGNVWEWTMDFYEEDYPTGTEEAPVIDPVGPETGLSVVARGCGWADLAENCRSAQRGGGEQTFSGDAFGFRLVRTKD